MKTLYLLRHAHAIEGAGIPDIDRPLSAQGQAEAQSLAAYVKNAGIAFDFVMCSGALRTQETFEPLRSLLRTQEIEIASDFYGLSEEGILEVVQGIPETATCALYIGHNPGVAFSMFRLSQTFPAALEEGVAPATCMGLQFPCERWADIRWGMGQMVTLFQPGQVPPAPKGS